MAEENSNGQVYDESYRGSKADRKPFHFTTSQGDVSFSLWINPSECSWRVPLRVSIEQIQGGAVHHEWDSTGIGGQQPKKLDQATINFTFQSGNLIPRGHMDVSSFDVSTGAPGLDQPMLPAGLGNFYDFINLLNQPNLTSDGLPNYVVIDYISMIFPSMRLKGFFSQEGVQWNDSSDNPLGITSWGATFVVFESSPELFDRGALTSVYETAFEDFFSSK